MWSITYPDRPFGHPFNRLNSGTAYRLPAPGQAKFLGSAKTVSLFDIYKFRNVLKPEQLRSC